MSKLFDACDDLHAAQMTAQSFAHMLHDLQCENADGAPDDLDVNDPASRTQRIFACIAGLQQQLKAIEGAEDVLRKAARHA